MNILECTIKMKQQTREHYERLSDAVVDPGLKKLFEMLAASEAEHITKLEKLNAGMNVVTAGEVADFGSLDESVCVFTPHLDPRHLAEALKDDPDAYGHVVQEEKETIEFFEQMKDQADNEHLKRIFRILAERERDHLAALENIYFFMEEPRTYLEWGEFSNLKRL